MFAATPGAPEQGGGGMSIGGFIGNVVGGLGSLVGGAIGLVGAGLHDVAKEAAVVIPGQQQIESDPFRTLEIGKSLVGFGPTGFDPSKYGITGDIWRRYSPLGPGGRPASETFRALYEQPVSFGLDALAVGSVAGKAAGAVGAGAIEGTAAAARAGSLTEALKLSGIGGKASTAAGVREGLDMLAETGQLGGLASTLRRTLPKATVRRVADTLEPMVPSLNPVTRAALAPLTRIGTEPVAALASRVSSLESELSGYLTARGYHLDDVGQLLDRSGAAVGLKAPKQLQKMVADYRIAKKLLDESKANNLSRIATDTAAHKVAGRIARQLLGQVGASGLMARNERMRAYTDTIARDIAANPEIAGKAAGQWQGLDIGIPDMPSAGWVDRPLEFSQLDNVRPITLGDSAPLRFSIDEATRQAARAAAPNWLDRTDEAVAGWQQLRQQIESDPAFFSAEMDVAQTLDSIDRHIDHLNSGVSDIVRAAQGEIDPSFGTAAKVRLLTMEQTRPLWEMGVITPTQMLERAYMPLRVKYGAKFNRIDDVWTGLDVKQLDDAVRAAGHSAPIYFPHIDPGEIGPWDLFRSKKRVGMVESAADPHLKRNQAKLLEQGSYITDPAEAFARRAARAVRAEETFRVFDTFAKRFGRELQPGQVRGANEVYWVPEIAGLAKRTGVGIQDLMDDLTSKGITREEAAAQALGIVNDNADYVSTLLSEGKPVTVYAVPRAVADQLDKAADWAKTFGKFPLYDAGMNAWRHLVLFTRPAYVMNQFLGNTVWAELQGAGLKASAEIIVRRFGEMLSAKRGRAVPDAVLARIEEMPGFRELGGGYFSSLSETYTPRNPRFEASALGQATIRAGQSKVALFGKRIMETERKMAAELDQAFRASGYVTAAERAMGVGAVKRVFRKYRSLSTRLDKLLKGGWGDDTSKIVDALNESKRFYGDFFALSPFERHVVRRYMFPFWGFTRHNLRLMAKFPMEYPGRGEVFQAISAADQEMRDQYGPLPDYLSGSMPFGPPGDQVSFFSMRGASPFEGAMQPWTSQLAPLPKIALERMTGRSLFTDQPFTAENVVTPFGSDQPYEIRPDGSVVPLQGHVLPGYLEHILRQFAPYSYAERFVTGDASTYDTATLIDMLTGSGVRKDATGAPVDQEGRLSVLAGLMGLPVNQVDVGAYQERLTTDQKAALAAALQRLGV